MLSQQPWPLTIKGFGVLAETTEGQLRLNPLVTGRRAEKNPRGSSWVYEHVCVLKVPCSPVSRLEPFHKFVLRVRYPSRECWQKCFVPP